MLENVTTLRMLLFSMTVVRRDMEVIVVAVTQKVVKMIANTESYLSRVRILVSPWLLT